MSRSRSLRLYSGLLTRTQALRLSGWSHASHGGTVTGPAEGRDVGAGAGQPLGSTLVTVEAKPSSGPAAAPGPASRLSASAAAAEPEAAQAEKRQRLVD